MLVEGGKERKEKKRKEKKRKEMNSDEHIDRLTIVFSDDVGMVVCFNGIRIRWLCIL